MLAGQCGEADKAMRQDWHGDEAERRGKVEASITAILESRRAARLSRGWQGGEDQSRQGSSVRVVLRCRMSHVPPGAVVN